MATIDALATALQSYTQAGSSLPTADAVECVNLTRRRMQRRHDWQPMQVSIELTVVAGAAPLPSDFLRELFVYVRDPSQSDPSLALFPVRRLLKQQWFLGENDTRTLRDATYPQVAAPAATSQVVVARAYYVWRNHLFIVPAPSVALTVSVDYARRLPDLVAGQTPAQQDTFTTLYVDVVRAGALAEAYDFLHEEERAARADARYELRLKEAIDADNALAFAGPPAKRGS